MSAAPETLPAGHGDVAGVRWTRVCRIEALPTLGARRVARARGGDVALFRAADDRVFALLDRCPHKGGPLSQGIVFGSSVACPLHNWTIELATGEARAPDAGCTPAFAVHLADGWVHLDADELASKALDAAAFSCPHQSADAAAPR